MITRNVNLLDCTLRDGGYVNNWLFGNYTIRSIISRLDNAGIDIIECGFLDSRVEYDKNRTLYPDILSIAKTIADSLPKNALLVAMIDYGTFDEERLIPRSESVIDGIRLIFKKEHMDAALEYGRIIKKLGYKLFLNPVALTSYRDEELLQLINKINQIEPYGMSIVDTYGLMFDDTVEKYIVLINSNLKPEIALGYHTHSNLDMSNAHCMTFINRNLSRDIVVDSSVLGMGKNAGNACTELIASYVDKIGVKKLDLNHIFECAYTDISKFKIASNWGYNLDYLLSALHDCSPNWIDFLMSKNTLSIKDIRTILDLLPYEKREVSYFSKEKAEQKYLAYVDKYVDDTQSRHIFSGEINGKEIFLLCPGKSLSTHKTEIDKYISQARPIVISVNFITDMFPVDMAFISNSNRYSQMLGIVSDIQNIPAVLLTSNIVPSDTLIPSHIFNYKTLYENISGDNSAILFISLLKSFGIAKVALAGMDGFDVDDLDDKYFDINMRLGKSDDANEALLGQLTRVLDGNMEIEWITPSKVKKALVEGSGH